MSSQTETHLQGQEFKKYLMKDPACKGIVVKKGRNIYNHFTISKESRDKEDIQKTTMCLRKFGIGASIWKDKSGTYNIEYVVPYNLARYHLNRQVIEGQTFQDVVKLNIPRIVCDEKTKKCTVPYSGGKRLNLRNTSIQINGLNAKIHNNTVNSIEFDDRFFKVIIGETHGSAEWRSEWNLTKNGGFSIPIPESNQNFTCNRHFDNNFIANNPIKLVCYPTDQFKTSLFNQYLYD